MEIHKLETVKEDIEHGIRAMERRFGVRITIHDRLGLLRDKNDGLLLPGRNLHPHPYCVNGRYDDPEWNRRCVRDCFHECERHATCSMQPFIKDCWKGVCELVIPVERDGTHVLTLFAGVFRHAGAQPPTCLNAVQQEIFLNLPEFEDFDFDGYTVALEMFGQGLLDAVNRIHADGEEPLGRKAAIGHYIRQHAHRNPRLEDLAKYLHLSTSRTSHLVSECLGFSFQELIVRERMLRAKVLLLSTDLTQEEVAATIGMDNVHHFNRLFKRFFGDAPGRFRKRARA